MGKMTDPIDRKILAALQNGPLTGTQLVRHSYSGHLGIGRIHNTSVEVWNAHLADLLRKGLIACTKLGDPEGVWSLTSTDEPEQEPGAPCSTCGNAYGWCSCPPKHPPTDEHTWGIWCSPKPGNNDPRGKSWLSQGYNGPTYPFPSREQAEEHMKILDPRHWTYEVKPLP